MKNRLVALTLVLLVAGVQRVQADGASPVSFDGYGGGWNAALSAKQLRPHTPHTVANVPVSTSTTAPDGSYRCHKISGDQLMDIGDLEISGGQATLIALPKGWVIKEVAVRGTNDRGQIIVAVDYRSTSGFNDRLDCLPK